MLIVEKMKKTKLHLKSLCRPEVDIHSPAAYDGSNETEIVKRETFIDN